MRLRYALMASAVPVLLPLSAAAQVAGWNEAVVDHGEIIVTARKREESIMKVPVVTTALDQQQLERFEISDISRVADQVPGLLVGQGASASYGAQLSLRGVGTSTLNTVLDQSVALNIDGQQFTHGIAYTAGMFDLAQITVLKGPQALFFGKASPGGVIAIRSADPGPDTEIIVRAGHEFEANAKQTDLIVSGPVSDQLGLRFAARFNDAEGYFRNVAQAVPGTGALDPKWRRGPNSTEWILRGTALWDSGDRFSAKLKVTYANKKNRGRVGQFASCPDGTAGPAGIPFLGNDDCIVDGKFAVVDLDPTAFIGVERGGRLFADVEQIFAALEMNYDVNDAITLTSVSGYYKSEQSELFNGNSSAGAGPALSSATTYDRRDLTQELRLASNFIESPLNFTVGAFFENTRQFKLGNARGNQALRLRLPVLLSDHSHRNPVDAQSVFGQLLWDITPQLELAGGARWTHEVRKHEFFNFLVSRTTPVPLAVPRISSSKVSPELTLTYTPTDNLTLFAALKKGYKSGSHNASGSNAPGDNTSFRDETVKGVEGGIKTRLLDRSLLFNLAGYYYKYGDLQVGASSEALDGLIVTRTLNAASARIYGIEMDAAYSPPGVNGLRLRAATNWNHARYEKFDNAPCWGGQMISEGCNRLLNHNGLFTAQDLSGRELLRAPEFSANIGADYEQPLGKKMKLFLATSMSYSSSYYTEVLLREDFIQPDFVKINANITLSDAEDRWELALIGNNLNDKVVRNRCSSSNAANGLLLGGVITGGSLRGPAGIDELVCSVDAGREVWLRGTLRF